jgi:hypothetical protein
MQNAEMNEQFLEFLGAFEIVFHYDWDYTEAMIGDVKNGCTFIYPGIEEKIGDWAARELLLEKYRDLKEFLKQRNIHTIIPEGWRKSIQNEYSDKENLD